MQRTATAVFVLVALCALMSAASARKLQQAAPSANVQALVSWSSGKRDSCTGAVTVKDAANQPIKGAWVRVRVGTAIFDGVTAKSGNIYRRGAPVAGQCVLEVLEVRPDGQAGAPMVLPTSGITATSKA